RLAQIRAPKAAPGSGSASARRWNHRPSTRHRVDEGVHVSQERRNPMAMARARHALLHAGLDSTVPLEPASSVTNEVWMSESHVIRVNRRPNQRLRREAVLGPSLPAEIGRQKGV
ncbi:MAG: hypothetical protein AAF915_27470, partial [Cyanobacteria bacterium P01_D01_bin.50]